MSTDEQTYEDEWEEEVEAQPPDKCPACGGNRFGTYVRGLIGRPDDELLRQWDQDEVRLTGCVISEEDAVSMIVNGFCKEVFRELPMEFAVEARKLLGVSLEGAVG